MEWAGLDENPNVNINAHLTPGTTLAALNDTGKTFKQIAKIIEENL